MNEKLKNLTYRAARFAPAKKLDIFCSQFKVWTIAVYQTALCGRLNDIHKILSILIFRFWSSEDCEVPDISTWNLSNETLNEYNLFHSDEDDLDDDEDDDEDEDDDNYNDINIDL